MITDETVEAFRFATDDQLMHESIRAGLEAVCADLVAAKDARIAELEAALVWYGEQARLCRLITGDGDAGRQAIVDDGGDKASAALKGGEA